MRNHVLPCVQSANVNYPLFKVRLHWRDFARDFTLAYTFSKENK